MPASVNEIISAKNLILSSKAFSKSPQMRKLLNFLVDGLISGDTRAISEYAIGIEVFDRRSDIYSTADDPIARVQVGRLRERLKKYYESLGTPASLKISIPLGSYMPVVLQAHDGGAKVPQRTTLEVSAIKCFSYGESGVYFANGLHEELVHQLHKTLHGDTPVQILLMTAKNHPDTKDVVSALAAQRLEGSVRIDEKRIRASIRLINTSEGSVTWSSQFDREIFLSIAQQEELARSICYEIKSYFFKP